jgi:predicted  nucleic acid-binding Zn-ribbon protein
MVRLRCKKCGNVFEQGRSSAVLTPHLGPYHYMKCPACARSSWFNVYSSVKDPVTYPSQDKKPEAQIQNEETEEEREKRRIEESKYERS